ncbi:alpha/beta hydrolase [Granulicella sp. S190]|uniref:alpha/beta hydrolase n=1 Tax=Granulicella sp. S190 TaxID=1747226 RepID=UPI00131D6D4F|nr:alpha/beta hydrolase [Granulicella sp. S190]
MKLAKHHVGALVDLDPACLKLIEENAGALPPERLSIDEARAEMRFGQDTLWTDYPVFCERITHAGCQIDLIRSHSAPAISPVVFFFHGGGWVMGDRQTHAYLIAELAVRSKLVIASVAYPLAPEVQFPHNLEAAYAAVKKVLSAAGDLRLQRSRFAFVGDSAGGNLAAALTLKAKQESDPQPALQVLLYPVLSASMDTESYESFGDTLNLTRSTMRWFWNQYVPEPSHRSHPLASLCLASDVDLVGLAPALILTSEFDILRDEGEAYAKRLRRVGVPVTALRSLGMLHGFLVVENLAKTKTGDMVLQLVANELTRALA